MPEELFYNIKTKIKREYLICFISAMVFGVLAHFYKLVNWLPNWDSLVFRYDGMKMAHFGRWLLSAADGLSSYYDLPWVNGLLALLFFSLGAACVCALLEITAPVPAVLLGALTVTFPAVTSTLAYGYTADGYALAFFLSCLAVLLISRGKRQSLAGAVLLMISLGIYQAYITAAVCLALLHLADCALFKGEPVSAVLKKAARFLIAGIFAAAAYLLIQRLTSRIFHVELSDYQSVAGAFSFSGLNFADALLLCIQKLSGWFFGGRSLFNLLNCAVFIITALCLIHAAAAQKFAPARVIPAAAAILLLPFGALLLYFAESDIVYHNLMLMSFWIFYIMPVWLYSRMKLPRLQRLRSWAILALCALTVYNNILIAGISYHRLQMAFYKSYSAVIRMSDRIEQTAGSENCTKIAIIGHIEEVWEYELPPTMTGIPKDYILLRTDPTIPGQSTTLSMLTDYCGHELTLCTPEETAAVKASGVLNGMSPWPSADSAAVSGDTIILYLSDE